MYVCELCNKTIKLKKSLVKHYKEFHPESFAELKKKLVRRKKNYLGTIVNVAGTLIIKTNT